MLFASAWACWADDGEGEQVVGEQRPSNFYGGVVDAVPVADVSRAHLDQRLGEELPVEVQELFGVAGDAEFSQERERELLVRCRLRASWCPRLGGVRGPFWS
jgi:hypothetical protein